MWLPPIIGGPATLDYIGCNVGESSSGKSIGGDVAEALLPSDRTDVLFDLQVGSGEGLVQSFMVPEIIDGKPTGKQVVGFNAAHFTIDEGTALMAQQGRAGTTIVQTMASAWSGQALGQANAKAENRRVIGKRRVRVSVLMNLQMANGHLILDETMVGIGLPQRVTFASAHDPTMPAVDDLPDWPGPLAYRSPPMVMLGSTMEVAAEVVDELREHRYAIATKRTTEPTLDGHLGLQRLKVAGLLAILDDRVNIDAEDWRLAGLVIATSVRIRNRLVRVKQIDDGERRRRSAEGRADYETHVEDGKERRAIAQLAAAIIGKAGAAGADGIGRADLKKATTASTTRHRFDVALDRAVGGGAITVEDGRVRATT